MMICAPFIGTLRGCVSPRGLRRRRNTIVDAVDVMDRTASSAVFIHSLLVTFASRTAEMTKDRANQTGTPSLATDINPIETSSVSRGGVSPRYT
jgi:hypothetical protein